MTEKHDFYTPLGAYALVLSFSFVAGIVFGLGEAESAHSPGSLLLYARRILLVACAALLPLVSGRGGIPAYGWKASPRWLLLSVILGTGIGFGNRGGFEPRHLSSLLLACFHAFSMELFFRGYLITTFSRSMKSFWGPVLVSSLCYGFFYLSVWTTWSLSIAGKLIFICLFSLLGILFGYCYKKSGSILVPWLMHFLGVLRYTSLL